MLIPFSFRSLKRLTISAFYRSIVAFSVCVLVFGCGKPDTNITASSKDQHHKTNTDDFSRNLEEESIKIDDLASARAELNENVWAQEVDAQRYEQFFIRLWDQLRAAPDKIAVLEGVSFRELSHAVPVGTAKLEHNILAFEFGTAATEVSPDGWKQLARQLRERGYEIVETEWHHSKFEPHEDGARSGVSFVLHLTRQLGGQPNASSAEQAEQRMIVRGVLNVQWNEDQVDPRPETIAVDNLEILVRTGTPAFQHMLTCKRTAGQSASAHPIIVYDLNGDGFPEILISRWNRVYWNEGGTRFREDVLFDHYEPLAEAGLVADVTSDGVVDFVTINREGKLLVYEGERSSFHEEPTIAASITAPLTLAMTAGDIDADGDVDLWITQYKPSYVGGQMPTPYYDANDGEPSFLLVNSGNGTFEDRTDDAGLATKRNRRTYSASFVDLDDDNDLDLFVVSDYSGIDVYFNDGSGHFEDVTERQLPNRSLFGMAHAFADFDKDGKTDVYAIGMSSTTA
ncbi:MAG: VCBS repeat-containing protein, partial [Planctomycetales bacterium]|nr:VCBS repeat-containing protein [Planctomycetales bacterium]